MAALQREQRFGHQQAQAVRFTGEGAQQHTGADHQIGGGDAGNGLAQHRLHHLGVGVLLENLHLAAHPGIAHGGIQRRHHVHYKTRQAEAQQQVRQFMTQRRGVVAADEGQMGAQIGAIQKHFCGAPMRLVDGVLGKLLQGLGRQRHDAPGPVPGVEQALDDAQLLHLLGRINALAEVVASRGRKAVAALPHPQRVLRQAGVAFNRGDRQGDAGEPWAVVHGGAERKLQSGMWFLCPGQNGVNR